MIGKTISHYRVIEKLGQGGMGEVFLAHDLSLDRKVALKFLPDIYLGDRERLVRFEREARLLASLNHPNIAAVYGFEQADGKRFLVMELVEGETLAHRIAKGPMPVADALEVCRQIAEGLEAAHEKGIIHRDLKPDNVKVTPEGKVKTLDFGIARAFHDHTSESDGRDATTVTAGMTGPGVLLGTAGYMSPEQVMGKPADKRADIWAFGCSLYECLSGKRAFEGETVTESLASILKGEVDWEILPAAIPLKVKDLLKRCLQKDPRERLHDIADARIEIAEALRLPTVPGAISVRRPIGARFLAAVFLALIVGAAAAALVTWKLRPMPTLPVVRSLLRIEAGHWLDGRRWATGRPTQTAMAVANDGGFIVYSAIVENPGQQAKPQIYLRRMDRMDATPVGGTEGGISPFLSPDDRWIGFWEGGKLKRVSVAGGVPATVCDAALLFGAHWAPDNTIVFCSGVSLGLSRVSAEGGRPEVLTVPDKAKEEDNHRLPHCLPDGRGVLFTVMRHWFDLQPRLALLDLETGKWRVLIEDAADGRYVRTGHLVFLRQGMLMGIAFDLDRLEVKGQAVPAVANVMQALNITGFGANTAAGQYGVSDSGWLVHVPGGILPDSENSLVRVDQKGDVQPVADFTDPFFSPRFSPDGQRIAYCTYGRENHVSIYDINRGTASRLTRDGLANWVAWTPDGKRLVFAWNKSGQSNLYWQPADGSSPMERLTTSENGHFPGSFTHDGSTLAFVETRLETGRDILLLDIKSRRVTPFLNSKAAEGWPEISPDGRWLAYASNENEPARTEVWVRSFPDLGGRWQISKGGGSQPIWSRDGRKLFYWQADQVWVVDIRTEGGFSTDKPRLVFEQRGIGGGAPLRNWDLWPDGQGFLMVKLAEDRPQPVTEMILVQNWLEELKRLVDIGKK